MHGPLPARALHADGRPLRHAQPLSLDAFGKSLHRYPAVTVSVRNLRPRSRGSVRLASADWRQAPRIAPNDLFDPDDVEVAAASIRLVRKLMATRRLRAVAPSEVTPGRKVTDRAGLVSAAGRCATTIFHPVGTAWMGEPQDEGAVVGTDLVVRDVPT